MRKLVLALFLFGLNGGSITRAADFMAMPAEKFASLAGLDARLDRECLDRDLLAAAVFHETNRVRQELGLPVLRWNAKLNDAAEIQAKVGLVFRPVSHFNPFPDIGTPLARVERVGLVPHRVTENIVLLSLYAVDLGMGLGVTGKGAMANYVDARTGVEAKVHTYRSYAALAVKAWMGSPGHRANIEDRTVQYLGCSTSLATGDAGDPLVFSVQVFYAPEIASRKRDQRLSQSRRTWALPPYER